MLIRYTQIEKGGMKMLLNKQLEIERKSKGLSKRELAQIIKTSTGLTFQVETIHRWEMGITTIDPRVLAFLSKLYNVSIEDLVSEHVDSVVNNKEKYYEFGKDISEYCSVENMAEFIRKYEVVNSNEWVVAPKYDLIMRCYEDYLKTEHGSYSACKVAFDTCQYWMLQDKSYDEDHLYNRIYDDGAGYLRIREKRDPVSYIELLEELEAVIDDISGYLELFETGGFNQWEYI